MSDAKYVGNTAPFWMLGKIASADVREVLDSTVLDLSIDLGHGTLSRMTLTFASPNVTRQRDGQAGLSRLCSCGGVYQMKDAQQLVGLALDCAVIRINGSTGIDPQLLCVDFRKL
jgi:hypothetical protein